MPKMCQSQMIDLGKMGSCKLYELVTNNVHNDMHQIASVSHDHLHKLPCIIVICVYGHSHMS